MKLNAKNTWITINILLAACMVYLAFAQGFTRLTWAVVALTHLSVLLYYFIAKELSEGGLSGTRGINLPCNASCYM